VGNSDCEYIGQGLLGQPVNTLSSLAYVAVGALLLRRALTARESERPALAVYAVVVAAVGFGSVVFHGPMPSWARFAHDLSIAAVLAFVIGYDVAFTCRAVRRVGLAGGAAVVGTSAVVLWLSPDASNGLVSALVVAAVLAEIAAARSPTGRAAARDLVRAPWGWVIGVVALGIGAALNALGRTDAPLCEPDSLAQLHGVWHVLTAVVLWVYGTAVLEPRERARPIIPA
jgi:ceramidase